MNQFQSRNRKLLYKTLGVVVCIILIKLLIHSLGFEVLSINALFSGIIAGTVFLMGFLLSGVLADFKESERIPGEMANSLSTISDELMCLFDSTRSQAAKQGLLSCLDFTEDLSSWFHRSVKTRDLLQMTRRFNDVFAQLGDYIPANYIVRLKTEVSTLKRLIIRTDSIRDTSFIASGYLIASCVTGLLCCGLILAKIDPFYESLFFVGVISFLMIFLLMLIRDLDNPFAYGSAESAEDVSLYPIERLREELREALKTRELKARGDESCSGS